MTLLNFETKISNLELEIKEMTSIQNALVENHKNEINDQISKNNQSKMEIEDLNDRVDKIKSENNKLLNSKNIEIKRLSASEEELKEEISY